MRTYPGDEPVSKGLEDLLREGYRPTSNRYRMVNRVDPERDPREVLYEAVMKQYRGLKNEAYWKKEKRRWVDMMGREACAEHFARVYSTETLTLSFDEWRDYKRLWREARSRVGLW